MRKSEEARAAAELERQAEEDRQLEKLRVLAIGVVALDSRQVEAIYEWLYTDPLFGPWSAGERAELVRDLLRFVRSRGAPGPRDERRRRER